MPQRDVDAFDTYGIESLMGCVTAETMWQRALLFGMVIDNDCPGQDLVGFYKNPDLEYEGTWYFPGDEITVDIVTLDAPPKILSIAEQEA
jgi:hypothetical protein